MIKLGRAYIHKKSGNEVVTQEFATIRINRKKIDGIIYHDSKLNNHVRTIDDFASQCELIK